MALARVERTLRTSMSAKEFLILGIKAWPRADFQRPLARCLRYAQFRPNDPTVHSDVDESALVVLTQRRGHPHGGANDPVLLVMGELFQPESRCPIEVNRQPKQRIGKTVDNARYRLALEVRRSGQPHVGHNNLDNTGLAPQVESARIAKKRAGSVQVVVRDGQRGIVWKSTLCIAISG